MLRHFKGKADSTFSCYLNNAPHLYWGLDPTNYVASPANRSVVSLRARRSGSFLP